jgi:hypothetical protein
MRTTTVRGVFDHWSGWMAETYYVIRGGKKIAVARGGKGTKAGGKFVSKAQAAAASGQLAHKVDSVLAQRVKERFVATHKWARDPKNAKLLDVAVRYLVARRHKGYTDAKPNKQFAAALSRYRAGTKAKALGAQLGGH